MSCQVSSVSQELGTLRGQASINRWEGLKEWHRRHQELLQDRLNNASSSLPDSHSENKSCVTTNLHEFQNGMPILNKFRNEEVTALKHDLSIISEGDEDNKDKTPIPHIDPVLGTNAPLNYKKQEETQPLERNKKDVDSVSLQVHNVQEKGNDKKPVRKPFLRKGQGLVRYNLCPGDAKQPYRRNSSMQAKIQDAQRKKVSSSSCNRASQGLQTSYNSKQKGELASVLSLTAPMQHLTLTAPQRSSVGTWSQVFGVTENPAEPLIVVDKSKKSSVREDEKLKYLSAVDEEQDSLAAYLDLEQHVGNASFCSTSSKVDRLVAKSSQSLLHPSNPDAIAQSKQWSPPKPQKRSGGEVGHNKNLIWTVSDLNGLLKSHNQHFNYADGNSNQATVSVVSENRNRAFSAGVSSAVTVDEVPIQDSSLGIHTKGLTCLLDQIGPARKPHLMKTMPSIDLDSSLVKNGLTMAHEQNGKFSRFDAGSDSSCSSTESDSESSSSEDSVGSGSPTKVDKKYITPDLHTTVSNLSKESITSHLPLDSVMVEGINKQIESHLEELRKEIKSLQEAKSKSQKYVSSLEKKVSELEHRLVIETHSHSKRLAEERQTLEKKILADEAKFLKEKQALQKTIREQRKNLADPVTQQELLRLKQEVVEWEEKWRADRAKARGQESNLRIQITNLKKENEKLKDENNKMRREKESAISAAKAKPVSNTRVINSIAQQLGKSKLKACALPADTGDQVNEKENRKRNSSTNDSRRHLPLLSAEKSPKISCVTTIGTFPNPSTSPDEWASEEETDLGKDESEDEYSFTNLQTQDVFPQRNGPINTFREKGFTSEAKHLKGQGETIVDSPIELTASVIEEAQVKYDALFGNDAIDTPKSCKNLLLESTPVHYPQGGQESNHSENYIKTVQHPDGKIEQIKKSGTRVFTYPDGTWERRSSNGSVMTVPACGWPIVISYFNGDKLEKLEDGVVRYFYAKSNTWQTTYTDGREELLYPSGQIEHRSKDGSTKVTFPTSSDSGVNKNNEREDFNLEGVRVEKDINGDTLILLQNGERELHTKEYMRKDFLDGTVKFVFKNGSQETRYPSGRIRIKDSYGNLIKDTVLSLT